MTAVLSPEDAGLLEELDRRECRDDPRLLLQKMLCWDERAGVEFQFNMSGEGDWAWQRNVIDDLVREQRTLVLKARQLGVTWLGVGYGVWTALCKPGSLSLFYRQKEADAKELIERAAIQLRSLPPHLLNNVRVRASKQQIELTYPDGKISRILAQSSADASGMGKTAAYVLLDEFAWIENAPQIMKSISSAAGQEGKVLIVSTANGVYNEQTGAGNYFHYLWSKAAEVGITTRFLPWSLHPARNQWWYEHAPEVQNLREWERKEQYPATPEEAFELTDACWFDRESMYWYAQEHILEPEYRGEFRAQGGKAKLIRQDQGWISVYQEPREDTRYAIGADVAEGTGLDFSAAYVVDLSTMALAAEFHGKLGADLYAEQLHYLGRWYNTALIAIESAGGWGIPVVIDLRDGRAGRPPYPRLYRHREYVRPDQLEHKKYGFPMTSATRPEVLEQLDACIRDRSLPYLSRGLHQEMRTFVRYDPRTGKKPSGAWPRAMEGSNDDRVMAAAITLEIYRERGHHPERDALRRKKRQQLPKSPVAQKKFFEHRYPK